MVPPAATLAVPLAGPTEKPETPFAPAKLCTMLVAFIEPSPVARSYPVPAL